MKTVELQAATSAAVDITSKTYDLTDQTAFFVAVVFSGGAGNLAGTQILQASLDGTTYFTVANSSVSVTSSANVSYDVSSCGYRYVRTKWTATSGSGNQTVTIYVKDPIK